MQRDLKIGISLCVLMFGVVGALMFRREQPATKAQSLQLKTAKQIDQKIAQRSRTPYMTGDIEQDDEQTPDAQDPQDGTRPAHLQPPNHLLEEDDGVLAPRNFGSIGAGRMTRSGSGINPIRPRGEAAPRIVTENVTPGPQTHTIQSGDTLSSISEKYLGSPNRFQEIFEANRLVLTNPNRLPEGVVISIPPPVKDVQRVSGQNSTERSSVHETRRPNSDLTAFEPISPNPGPVEDRSTKVDHKSAIVSDKPESLDTDGKVVEAKPTDPKPTETKKRFAAPSRLPFGHNVTPIRKPVEPVNATVPESKESNETDPAHGSTRQTYQVRKGDSLERISQRVYGNPKRAADIFNANRDKLASPDAVKEGLELELP